MLTIFTIAATWGIVAYGPPSNHEAFIAYETRLMRSIREAGDYAFEEKMYYRPEYPSDVSIQKCVRRAERGVRLENGTIEYHNGYECIIEVWPNGRPSFTTSGFFKHDGFDWVYYGALSDTQLPPQSLFDPSPSDKGQTAVKPGAVLYRGDPYAPLNPNYNPYEDFFESNSWEESGPQY